MTQNTSFSLIHGSRVFDRRDVMLRKWDSASCLGHEPRWAQHQGVSDGMQPENVLLPCAAAWFCSSFIDLASDRIQRTCKPYRLSETLPWNPGLEHTGPYPQQLLSPNRRGELRGDLQTETFGHPRSQIGVDLVPVGVDRALLNEALDALAHVGDDIMDQVLAVGLRHHVAVEIARLHEVVVLRMQGIRAAH